jgi:uncharacterized protein YodC (DUF2158 family)
MSAFKPGDTVILKSGGPTMTIESVETVEGVTYALCVWFVKDETKRGNFATYTLAPN